MTSPLVCPSCRSPLDVADDVAVCRACARVFPIQDGIVDFSGGRYYDHFDDETELSADARRGLELEVDGSRRRIVDFYAPHIRRLLPDAKRVLDCGCGNGLSVDLLNDAGFDAWGNDLSALRKWQWHERRRRDRLVVADALALPFDDGWFDVVISSGVIEHIGVDESAIGGYRVSPRADRDEQRLRFLREIARVTRPGGLVLLDFPNGAFPIDFWHGDRPGSPRFHSLHEGFLPSFGEVRGLIANAMNGARAEAISPYRRLQFEQASQHWYGKLLRLPVGLLFRAMTWPGGRWMAGTFVNPFLVVGVRRD